MKKSDVERKLDNELRDMPWKFKFIQMGKEEEKKLFLDLGNRPLGNLEEKAEEEAKEEIENTEDGDVIPLSEFMDSAITKENDKFFKGSLSRVKDGWALTGMMEELSEEKAVDVLREEYKKTTLAEIPNRAHIRIDRIEKINTHETGDIKAVVISLKTGGEIEFRNNGGISLSFL